MGANPVLRATLGKFVEIAFLEASQTDSKSPAGRLLKIPRPNNFANPVSNPPLGMVLRQIGHEAVGLEIGNLRSPRSETRKSRG